MERAQIAIVVVVVAAVALFALNVVSHHDSLVSEYDAGRGDYRVDSPLSEAEEGGGGVGPSTASADRQGRAPGVHSKGDRAGRRDRLAGLSGAAGGGPDTVVAGGSRSGLHSTSRRTGSSNASLREAVRAAGAESAPRPGAGIGPKRDFDLPEIGQGPPSLEQQLTGSDSADGQPADEKNTDLLLSLPLDGKVETSDNTPPSLAEDLKVDENGVNFTDTSELVFPADGHVNGAAGTIQFDIDPDWAGADQTNNSLLQIRNEHKRENTLQLVKNFNSLRFIFIDNTGQERNVNIYIDDWQAGQPHQVSATWGDALLSLYVDGELVGSNTYPGQLEIAPGTPIHVGSDFLGTSYAGAGGTISNLKVYGRALGADEVVNGGAAAPAAAQQ
jgi:hypothetical protein